MIPIRYATQEMAPIALHAADQALVITLHAEARQLLAQRDAALAACKQSLKWIDGLRDQDNPKLTRRIKRLLAEAEGKAP